MKFNQLSMLAKAIKHRVGSPTSTWNCAEMGHYVQPDFIARKIVDHDFHLGDLRFIATCVKCKKQIGYHCGTGTEGQIYKSEYDLDVPSSRNDYFASVLPSKDTFEVSRACFCGNHRVTVEGLCEQHTIEVLLRSKIEGTEVGDLVNRVSEDDRHVIRMPSLRVQTAIAQVVKGLGQDELLDFSLAWFEVVQKIKLPDNGKYERIAPNRKASTSR